MDPTALADRLQRLKQLIPKLLADQPQGSAVAVLLTVMATALMELEEATDRALHDHWLALASGESPWDQGGKGLAEASDGLSRLGRLVAVRRLGQFTSAPEGAGSVVDLEEVEAFRQRMRHTVPLRCIGSTSPPALLRLAIVMLGAEVCERGMVKVHDSWIARGLPPDLDRRNCAVCGTGAPSSSGCPLAVLEARVIDSPLSSETLTRQLGGGMACEVEVLHPSLTEAWPELVLEAVGEAIANPVLENRATGEQLLFAGTVPKGSQLRIQPQVEEMGLLLESNEAIDPYPWRHEFPNGQALLFPPHGEGGSTDVSADVWLLSGSRFPLEKEDSGAPDDAPRFDQARFGGITRVSGGDHVLDQGRLGSMRLGPLSQFVQVPRLRPGSNAWRCGSYGTNPLALDPEKLLANPPNADLPECTLTMRWWSRPPASFRLEVEPILEQGGGAWRQRAERIGALAELRWLVERIRPAGVRAEVRFPEPPLRDSQGLAERPLALVVTRAEREVQPLADGAPQLAVVVRPVERQVLVDHTPAWGAVLDVCRLDAAYLQ